MIWVFLVSFALIFFILGYAAGTMSMVAHLREANDSNENLILRLKEKELNEDPADWWKRQSE